MGDILGIGVTHYPGLIQPDEQMAGLLNRTLNSDQVPDASRISPPRATSPPVAAVPWIATTADPCDGANRDSDRPSDRAVRSTA